VPLAHCGCADVKHISRGILVITSSRSELLRLLAQVFEGQQVAKSFRYEVSSAERTLGFVPVGTVKEQA
jgi:hypothetical protein